MPRIVRCEECCVVAHGGGGRPGPGIEEGLGCMAGCAGFRYEANPSTS